MFFILSKESHLEHPNTSKPLYNSSHTTESMSYPFHDDCSSEIIQQTIDYGSSVISSFSKKPSSFKNRNQNKVVSYSVGHGFPSLVIDKSNYCQYSLETTREDFSCNTQFSLFDPDVPSGDHKSDIALQLDGIPSTQTMAPEIISPNRRGSSSKNLTITNSKIHQKKAKKPLKRMCLSLKLSCCRRWNMMKKSKRKNAAPDGSEVTSASSNVRKSEFKDFGSETHRGKPKTVAIVTSEWLKNVHSKVLRDAAGGTETHRGKLKTVAIVTSEWLKNVHSKVLRDAAGVTSGLSIDRNSPPIFVSVFTSNEDLMKTLSPKEMYLQTGTELTQSLFASNGPIIKIQTMSFNGGSSKITNLSINERPKNEMAVMTEPLMHPQHLSRSVKTTRSTSDSEKTRSSNWTDVVFDKIIGFMGCQKAQDPLETQSCGTRMTPVQILSFSHHPRSFRSSIVLDHRNLKTISSRLCQGNCNMLNELQIQKSRPDLPLCPSDLAEKVAKKIIWHMQWQSQAKFDTSERGVNVGTDRYTIRQTTLTTQNHKLDVSSEITSEIDYQSSKYSTKFNTYVTPSLKSDQDNFLVRQTKPKCLSYNSEQTSGSDSKNSRDTIKITTRSSRQDDEATWPPYYYKSFGVRTSHYIHNIHMAKSACQLPRIILNQEKRDQRRSADFNMNQNPNPEIISRESEQTSEKDSRDLNNSTKSNTFMNVKDSVLDRNICNQEISSCILVQPLEDDSQSSTEIKNKNTILESEPVSANNIPKQEIQRCVLLQPPEKCYHCSRESKITKTDLKIVTEYNTFQSSKPKLPSKTSTAPPKECFSIESCCLTVNHKPDYNTLQPSKPQVPSETSAESPEEDYQRPSEYSCPTVNHIPDYAAIRTQEQAIMCCISTPNKDNNLQSIKESRSACCPESAARPENECRCSTRLHEYGSEDSKTSKDRPIHSSTTDLECNEDFGKIVEQLALQITAEVEMLKAYAMKAYPRIRHAYTCVKTHACFNPTVKNVHTKTESTTAFSRSDDNLEKDISQTSFTSISSTVKKERTKSTIACSKSNSKRKKRDKTQRGFDPIVKNVQTEFTTAFSISNVNLNKDIIQTGIDPIVKSVQAEVTTALSKDKGITETGCNPVVKNVQTEVTTAFFKRKANRKKEIAELVKSVQTEDFTCFSESNDKEEEMLYSISSSKDITKTETATNCPSTRNVDKQICPDNVTCCNCGSKTCGCKCTKLEMKFVDLSYNVSRAKVINSIESRKCNIMSKTREIQVPLTKTASTQSLGLEDMDCDVSIVQYISNLFNEKIAQVKGKFQKREEPLISEDKGKVQVFQALFRAVQVYVGEPYIEEAGMHDNESQTSYVAMAPVSCSPMHLAKGFAKPSRPDGTKPYKKLSQRKSVWHTKMCSIHRGTACDSSCESTTEWCVSMRQSSLVNHAFSVTNICGGNEREDLKAVYYMLSALEGRVRRMKWSSGTFS